MSNHVVLLHALSNSIRLYPKISLNQQAPPVEPIFYYFDTVDSDPAFVLFLVFHLLLLGDSAKVFGHYFVLLVNVDDVDVPLFIGRVQFLGALIPKHASVHRLVRVLDRNLLSPLCSFKPFECLIVGNRKYQVLLGYEQDLNNSYAMNTFLLND